MPQHSADHRLARGQRLGGHDRELAPRIGVGQAVHVLDGDAAALGPQQPVVQAIGLHQLEPGAQRHGIVGADRADEQFASIGGANHFMPGRKTVTSGHAGMLARPK